MTPLPFSSHRLIAWLLLIVLIATFAVYLPPPSGLPEPPQVTEIFNPPILVAPDSDGYRFIEFGKQGDAAQIYAVSRMTTAYQNVTRTFGRDASGWSLGFFHLHAAWRFELVTTRFDRHWNSKTDGAVDLPRSELVKLRPLVIAELHRRDPSRGERLKLLLEHGLSTETVICWQNAVVLLAWLAPVLALLMILRGRCVKKTRP